MSLPPIEQPAELIRDEPWTYPGIGTPQTRRLRVWRVAPHGVLAMLTQTATDGGTSIETAARDIRLMLEREYPTDALCYIEHWGPGAGAILAEHFAVVTWSGDGVAWSHVDPADLAERLPGLDLAADDPCPGDISAEVWALTRGLTRDQLGELVRAAAGRLGDAKLRAAGLELG